MAITAEHGTYTRDGCGRRLPFENFQDAGRIDSDSGNWYCGTCNRCPDCGNNMGNGRPYRHHCRLLALAKAIGVEMTSSERRIIGWLAGTLDESQTADMVALFDRVREEAQVGSFDDIDIDTDRWEIVQ